MCLTCILRSLPLEQQFALLLKEVYQFKISEIAEILEQSAEMVKSHAREIVILNKELMVKRVAFKAVRFVETKFGFPGELKKEIMKRLRLLGEESHAKACLRNDLPNGPTRGLRASRAAGC